MNSTLLFASLYLAIKDKRNTRMEISLFQEHLLSAYVYEGVKIYLNHIDSQYFEFISNIFLFYLKIVIYCEAYRNIMSNVYLHAFQILNTTK